jgi:hypothetical protein
MDLQHHLPLICHPEPSNSMQQNSDFQGFLLRSTHIVNTAHLLRFYPKNGTGRRAGLGIWELLSPPSRWPALLGASCLSQDRGLISKRLSNPPGY